MKIDYMLLRLQRWCSDHNYELSLYVNGAVTLQQIDKPFYSLSVFPSITSCYKSVIINNEVITDIFNV